jgi:hypothetical protein
MKTIALTALAALAIAGSANAATVFSGADNGVGPGGPFTNSAAAESAFLAAAGAFGSIAKETFESQTSRLGPYTLAGGMTASITGQDFGNNFTGVNSTTLGVVYGFNTTSGGEKWLGFPVGTATFNFAGAGTNSFGLYLTGLQTVFGAKITLTQLDGNLLSFDIAKNVNGGAQYFGIVDTTAFSAVSISAVGDNDAWGVDDISFNAVPEPGTWAMLIMGFGLIGAASRRKRAAIA